MRSLCTAKNTRSSTLPGGPSSSRGRCSTPTLRSSSGRSCLTRNSYSPSPSALPNSVAQTPRRIPGGNGGSRSRAICAGEPTAHSSAIDSPDDHQRHPRRTRSDTHRPLQLTVLTEPATATAPLATSTRTLPESLNTYSPRTQTSDSTHSHHLDPPPHSSPTKPPFRP